MSFLESILLPVCIELQLFEHNDIYIYIYIFDPTFLNNYYIYNTDIHVDTYLEAFV